jgi:hypothetical protein
LRLYFLFSLQYPIVDRHGGEIYRFVDSLPPFALTTYCSVGCLSQAAAGIHRARWIRMLPPSPSQVRHDTRLDSHCTRPSNIADHLFHLTVRVRPFTIREAAQL